MPKQTRYIISTIDGEMPSVVIFGEKRAEEAFKRHLKGWPEKEWIAFKFSYDKPHLTDFACVKGNCPDKTSEKVAEYVLTELKLKIKCKNVVAA